MKNKNKNIVLVGMPKCGKTTIGKIISKRLNMPFIDTADLVEQKIGVSTDAYVEKFGEEALLNIENVVAQELSNISGSVIELGGKIVLNKNNAEFYKPNSVVFYISRNVHDLFEKIPLDNADVIRMYYERFDFFGMVNDYAVNGATPDEIASKIINYFEVK